MGQRNAFTYVASSSGRLMPDTFWTRDLQSFTTSSSFSNNNGGGAANTYTNERGFAGGVTTQTVREQGLVSINNTYQSGITNHRSSGLWSGDTFNSFRSYDDRNDIKDTGGVTTSTESYSQADTTDHETGFSYTRRNETNSAVQSGGLDLVSNSGTTERDYFRLVISSEQNRVGRVYDSRLVKSGASGRSVTFITVDSEGNNSGIEQTAFKSGEYFFSQVQSAGGYARTYAASKLTISAEVTGDDNTAEWSSEQSEGIIDQTNTIGGTTWFQRNFHENFTTTFETTYGNASGSPVSQSEGEAGFSSTKDIGSSNSLPPINGLPSWISIQSTSGGTGGGSSNILTVTIADNTGTADRTGYAIFGGITEPGQTEVINETITDTTFAKLMGASTFAQNTTGLTTRLKNQATTKTYRSTIGTFFNEEVTRRYTSSTPTDYIEQDIEARITSRAGLESWRDPREPVRLSFKYIIDSTFSAIGGVKGFIPNEKIEISGTVTRAGLVNDAQSYYHYDGETVSYDDYPLYSTHGTGDQVTASYSYNNYTESTETEADVFGDDISEDYSYWRRDQINYTTRYRSNGFLDLTENTYSLTTNSRIIIWDYTSAGTRATTPTTTLSYGALLQPTFARTDYPSSHTFQELRTYLGQSSTDTITVLGYFRTSYSTAQQVVSSKAGENISWSSIVKLENQTAFDSLFMSANIAYANTYESYHPYSQYGGESEIAFATETNTNRESRDKLSPPRIRYTEWYLATTLVSSNVTIYTKSTRTDESWYIPDVSETSRLNGLIYFPENTNVEIVDKRHNAMSFDQNGKITQIVGATFTWTTNSDNLTRSTTSNFLKILETKGGLEKMTNPKSISLGAAASGRYQTIFGGNNEYDENGAILLHEGCTITAYDVDGGSTLLSNSNPTRITSTLKKGAGMLSFDATENYAARPGLRKNEYLQTSRLRPQFQAPTFTSPTYNTYSSYYFYYPYY